MRPRALTWLLLAALSLVLSDCATSGPNPCIGPYSARLTMPCTCPQTLDPACEPWPTDTRSPDGGARD